MAAWKYIKGSEKDFEGAPEWATCKCYCSRIKEKVNDDWAWCEGIFAGAKWCDVTDGELNGNMSYPDQWHPIAQRERVTSINDDRLQSIVEVNVKVPSKEEMDAYNKRFDPVDVNAFMADKVSNDNVNHPKHYTQGSIECIDAIKAATVGKTGIEAVCVANVVKYLWRYEEKNGVEDVKKARWYLERLIEEMSK